MIFALLNIIALLWNAFLITFMVTLFQVSKMYDSEYLNWVHTSHNDVSPAYVTICGVWLIVSVIISIIIVETTNNKIEQYTKKVKKS